MRTISVYLYVYNTANNNGNHTHTRVHLYVCVCVRASLNNEIAQPIRHVKGQWASEFDY